MSQYRLSKQLLILDKIKCQWKHVFCVCIYLPIDVYIYICMCSDSSITYKIVKMCIVSLSTLCNIYSCIAYLNTLQMLMAAIINAFNKVIRILT